MQIIPNHINKIHDDHALDLPISIRTALEVHKTNLIALYSSMSEANQDTDLLEKQAMYIMTLYQEELIKALKASLSKNRSKPGDKV